MNILNRIRRKFVYTELTPLYYTEALKNSYCGTSVTGSQLQGKLAVVTGAYGGIGQAIVKRLVDEGCKVVLLGRNESKLKECVSILGVEKADYVVIDLSSYQSVAQVAESLIKNYSIDILVNCAGVLTDVDKGRRFRGVTKEQYLNVLNVNLKSTMLLSMLVAEQMFERAVDSSIINIASICGLFDSFGHTPYGISKSGLIEFTNLLQKKYEDSNILVSGIAPGSVATVMGNKQTGSNITIHTNITRHVALSEEIASLVAFLCGQSGRYFRGKTIVASGREKL